ncbi:MAG: PolC-type DNA polymerase III [Clostridiales bacterium]|nr:PolC-type DNA polymerase III [Clostridiales bacterium]
MTLYEFAMQTSQDEDLAKIAKAIPSEVTEISIDERFEGMELKIALTGPISSKRALKAMEQYLRQVLHLSHLRIYITNMQSEYGKLSIPSVLDWILWVINTKTGYGACIDELVFDENAVRILLQTQLSDEVKDSISDFINQFASTYLLSKWELKYEFNPPDTSAVSDPDYFLNRMRERATQHAKTAVDDAISSASVSSTRESSSDGKKKKVEEPTPDMDKNSWEYKSIVEKKHIKQEKKTDFRRGQKFEDASDSGEVVWGFNDMSAKKYKIKDAISKAGSNTLTPDTIIRLEGEIKVDTESQRLVGKNKNMILYKFFLADDTYAVDCVFFPSPKDADLLNDKYGKGGYVGISCTIGYSKFDGQINATVKGFYVAEPPKKRKDTAEEKRVELHAHTKMSEKDAVIEPKDLIKTAYRMGHPACAITDHGVVQGFNDAYAAYKDCKKKGDVPGFKLIFGMEGYLVDDGNCIAYHIKEEDVSLDSFVALDVETTGLDCTKDGLLEIAAIRYEKQDNGEYKEADVFTTMVDPGIPISDKAKELTGITEDMIKGAPTPFEAVTKLSEFMKKEDVIVGHNIFFDMGFIREAGFQIDIEQLDEEKHHPYRVKFYQPEIDTVSAVTFLYPEMEKHNLKDACAYLGIVNESEHRAMGDCRASAQILIRCIKDFGFTSCKQMNEHVGMLPASEVSKRKTPSYHIIFLVRDTLGLYNVYRMVSEGHTEYFCMRPRIPKSEVRYLSAGVIVGGACERGQIFRAVHQAYVANGNNLDKTLEALSSDSKFNRMIRLYDYFEIQPICNNEFYLREEDSGLRSREDLININKIIAIMAECVGKPCCATTDAHFLEKKDGEYRKYMLMDMGFKDAELQSDLYFRTTDEMLEEFSYLGEKRCKEVVIDSPKGIADLIRDDIKPFPDGTYPPVILSAPDDLRNIVNDTMKKMYEHEGQIPEIVQQRVDKELNSIIGNGYSIMYYIAYKLVGKSNSDGYVVGSRGSVGSSLVATLSGISEVNPLPPHRRCPKCNYSEFDLTGAYGSGYDLPVEPCPKCGTMMLSDGQDIPFETFLGFYGDKQPDIDLNFSGEYQPRAHKYVEELFGKHHTFRAGTIGCFADKNAIALVKNICDAKGETVTDAELNRRAAGLIGVKRTTGQHPGGIVVLPKEMDIYEFTPVQHPANKLDCGIITTHYDFNALHDTILKLDILGHDDPTMIRMLTDLTGVDVQKIPIPDPKVMSLFTSTEALGIPDGTSPAGAATLGLPELGTKMAREMIKETQPSRFYDLVQLMGLSHGTDVWNGNAQDLIRNGTCTLETVIGCRDSIMTRLIYWGLPNKEAFDIMEAVRKGKVAKGKEPRWPEFKQHMQEHGVPDWYIESCNKIKYMFPKAHAAAYAISALRIAWFKVNYPEEYYCAFFTIRADEFDGDLLCKGIEYVTAKRLELDNGLQRRKPNEKSLYYLCELVEEMYLRGITFVPYDLNKSDAVKFIKVEKGKILPPFNVISSISTSMGEAIVAARNERPFSTQDDLATRAHLGPSAMQKLEEEGLISQLPRSRQLDLFDLL